MNSEDSSNKNEKKDIKKRLEEIYNLFQGLEKDSKDGSFDQMMLNELIQLISNLPTEIDPVLKKIITYKDQLKPSMTLRHLATIAVPFERYLKKNITDDDFLVSFQDRDHLVTERAPVHVIVDNMRSAFNVGSIFRTCDTLGFQKIWLTGYSPTPHQLQVDKAALGSTFVVEWESKKFLDVIQDLKKINFHIIALETSAKALSIYEDFNTEKPIAFIIGNERFGLDNEQLSIADEIRKIPTFGIKNSLNAAVAFAMAGYEWRKQKEENSKGSH